MPKLAVFKDISGVQLVLFPENIFDKIPKNYHVYSVNQVVDWMDIKNN